MQLFNLLLFISYDGLKYHWAVNSFSYKKKQIQMKNAYTGGKENALICYEGVLLIWNISIALKSCLVLEWCNSGGAK